MRVIGVALVTVSALTLAAPARAQCPVGQSAVKGGAVSRLRLKPGDSRRFVTSMDETVSETVMGQPRKTRQVLATGVRFDVGKGAAAGHENVRMTYESVRVRIESPVMNVDYDSSHPDSVVPTMARPFAALVGHGVTVSLAHDGSVAGVTGADSLVNAMVDATGGAGGASRGDIASSLKHQFGDSAMGRVMQDVIMTVPDHSMSVGQSWTCATTVRMPLPMTQVSRWTVRSLDNGVATLDVSSEMSSDSTASVPLGSTSMSMRYALHGKAAGTRQVEEKTGWVVHSSLEGDVSGSVTVEGSPQGDVQMPMSIHLKSVVAPAGN